VVAFAVPLLTAGLNLAQNLIVEWVKTGRSQVKVTEVQSSIASQAYLEAERLRVRVDDLERATNDMMLQLVERTPQLSYSKGFARGPVLNLQFDPRSPSSSKEMLQDLRRRVGEISADLVKRPEAAETKDIPKVIVDPGPDADREERKTPKQRRSAAMIEELRDRVRDAEDPRK
jgi:hypothetical protein